VARRVVGPAASAWEPREAILLTAADELYTQRSLTERTWAGMDLTTSQRDRPRLRPVEQRSVRAGSEGQLALRASSICTQELLLTVPSVLRCNRKCHRIAEPRYMCYDSGIVRTDSSVRRLPTAASATIRRPSLRRVVLHV
jgi:hypothetical protein